MEVEYTSSTDIVKTVRLAFVITEAIVISVNMSCLQVCGVNASEIAYLSLGQYTIID